MMNGDGTRLWTDRSCLQHVQYRTDANLAARQSIFAYQHPRIDLPAAVLDLAGLRGDEAVADVGCGNGAYLAELARRGHAGPVLGMDLSTGMLGAARRRAPAAALAAGDAAALPLGLGLQPRRCEEPVLPSPAIDPNATPPTAPVTHPSDIWSLWRWCPAAANAAYQDTPVAIIWQFQLTGC